MQTENWTTYLGIASFLSALACIATININKKDLAALGFLFLVISATSIMTLFYINAKNVGYPDLGTPAQFGQLGDYFGGILNPIFGFLTVILLLQTYKLGREDTKRESRKTTRDELKSIIRDFSTLIEKRKNEKVFKFTGMHETDSLINLYISNVDQYSQGLNDLLQVIVNTQNLDIDDVNYRTDKLKYRAMLDMRSNIFHIVNLYLSLIDPNESDTVNTYTFMQLDDFLFEQMKHYLITQTEHMKYIEAARIKNGKLPNGFTPKWETPTHISFVSAGIQTNQGYASITQTPRD